ncbi:MAG: hypothetical protein RBR09_14270, partial [Desulfobulbaceae bacterium]|nr:hypothetical protein [Desulfobulbaceae bacterium]
LYRQFKKYEKGKFFFKEYYPDYNLPSFNQRQEELKTAIEKVKLSFLSDFKKYIEGKIDLVHFATPFLMLIIRCGVCAAWVEKETGYEKGAMFENLDLEKFVLRIQEIISELEPTELLYASGETGEKVQILAERNKRLAEQLAEKSSQLEEKERYIRSLLDSRSWKITAPLRKIMGVLTK